MGRRKQSHGICAYCEREMAKGGMSKHLDTCPQRKVVIDATREHGGSTDVLYHLRVQDAWAGNYWLDLEMRGSATLNDLDSYLRGIWLECCGHLSAFYLGKRYGEEVNMRRRISDVFRPDVELFHIYDFGTSSETKIKCVEMRRGKPTTPKPIALMARNKMPEAKCIECGEPATHFCEECQIEHDSEGTLCDEHAEDHPHNRYGEPMPLVNSPRCGMCGYDGSAEPPY